jgi:hypothetical protein
MQTHKRKRSKQPDERWESDPTEPRLRGEIRMLEEKLAATRAGVGHTPDVHKNNNTLTLDMQTPVAEELALTTKVAECVIHLRLYKWLRSSNLSGIVAAYAIHPSECAAAIVFRYRALDKQIENVELRLSRHQRAVAEYRSEASMNTILFEPVLPGVPSVLNAFKIFQRRFHISSVRSSAGGPSHTNDASAVIAQADDLLLRQQTQLGAAISGRLARDSKLVAERFKSVVRLELYKSLQNPRLANLILEFALDAIEIAGRVEGLYMDMESECETMADHLMDHSHRVSNGCVEAINSMVKVDPICSDLKVARGSSAFDRYDIVSEFPYMDVHLSPSMFRSEHVENVLNWLDVEPARFWNFLFYSQRRTDDRWEFFRGDTLSMWRSLDGLDEDDQPRISTFKSVFIQYAHSPTVQLSEQMTSIYMERIACERMRPDHCPYYRTRAPNDTKYVVYNILAIARCMKICTFLYPDQMCGQFFTRFLLGDESNSTNATQKASPVKSSTRN